MVFGRRYRMTEKIGSGGMADVYKAVDEVLGRTVAVKVMHPRYAADPSFAARFRQEAQAAANLQSPYIVNIYDWGQDGDTYYIVMELVRGTDLKTIIQQKGPLPAQRIAAIGAQVCSALVVAHGYDVIHRDIKPHNIMVAPDGAVKVMDFGIARAGNTTMTQTGSVLGTAHYVSPEQAQGRPLGAPSDLYSLGVVLYEAATGRLPFDAETPVAVALKQVNEPLAPPHTVNPNIDPGLEAVIMTAMAKDPAQRYETADEMKRDLMRVAQGREVSGAALAGAAVAGGAAAAAAQTSVMKPVPSDPYAPDNVAAPVRRPEPKKKNLTWVWILVAVGLVAAGLGVAWGLGLLGPQGVAVPKLVGMKVADAQATITQQGFTIGKVDEVFNADVPAGEVIDQSPVAGATAEKGSAISLTVSKGAEMLQVPTLMGLSEAEAQKAISDAGFQPQPLPSEFSGDVSPGIVIKQSPAPGDKAAKGSAVQYVISRGPEVSTVPDVIGKSKADATSALDKAGFKASVKEQFSDSVPAGKVISQNPAGNLEVAKGSTVTIFVSKGTDTVVVPDTIGKSEGEAKAALEAVGLVAKVAYEMHSGNGLVIAQDITAGTKVKKGSTVNITVDATQ